jgi:GWxTD domain-containing protein
MLAVVTAGVVLPASAQDTVPEFDVDVVSLREGNDSFLSRVDIYSRVPFQNLEFSPTPEGFTAQYRMSAQVVQLAEDGLDGNVVLSPIYDRTVRVPDHASTQSEAFVDLTTRTVSLVPGRYRMEFALEDLSTGDTFVREVEAEVKDFASEFVLSDLLLLNDFDRDSGSVYPNVSNRLPVNMVSLPVLVELYGRVGSAFTLQTQVRRVSTSAAVPLTTEDAMRIARDDTSPSEVVYDEDLDVRLEADRNQHVVHVPVEDLGVGQYLVQFRLVGESGEIVSESERVFCIDWAGLGEFLDDLDEAISQLEYIAKPREIRHMRSSGSNSEKLARFQDFWKRRDPTPGTRRNERMEEYYYRIDHANRRYGSLTDGWKTDRGQVVVLFGEPDYVERHPFNFNVEPYEVWFYYRIGRRYIFVDRSGLGDYEILVPIWDERTRIR